MGIYRRRATAEIEAVQWTGDNTKECWDFTDGELHAPPMPSMPATLWVTKSHTFAFLDIGTWIIKESDGSGFYPCAEDVFAASYEVAE